MMVEAVQTYVRLVNGLTRATRDKARAAAHDLFAQVGLEDVANDAEQRVGKLTEEILSASRANRELLEKLVATEVTKAASRLGFVRFDDLDEVREEIAELRAQLARQQRGGGSAPTATTATGATTSPAGTSAARKSPAKKAPAKKTPAAGTATATTATKSTAKRSTTRATGAAQRLAAEREASPGPTPAAPRAARARRATSGAAAPAAAAPAPAPVPDPTADAGA